MLGLRCPPQPYCLPGVESLLPEPLLAILPSSAGLIATSSVSLRDGVQTFDQTLSPGVAVICLHCTFVFESRA